ncbi:DUF4189 domain-containing protein [Xanthomonas arboricola pv. corylina]|uniref:DUF4189 domain-containing protein n=1 Tax=Xanthomonas arboricola TaxID=56448 RepID=UPI0021581151|nr:DUF4189 domain-containing protein [Xanthomonas arboricola]MDN0205078.1 DUF4189 domain-containing protein [Xanthomonas arboricola pv. corylina]MDN0218053.1 DUF4189 domain-containing protein [Xanthomonas arboricola pv. corylina]
MLNSNLMRNILYMSLAIWCGFPFAAIAQTACPNGVAPGSPQCGPDSGTSRANPAPPQPTGRWIKTWGALAKNSSGDMGFSAGKIERDNAEAEAISRCESFGAGSCQVFETFNNQCISTAVSSSGQAGIAIAPTKEKASSLATEKCEKSFAGVCKVTLAECIRPIFEKF